MKWISNPESRQTMSMEAIEGGIEQLYPAARKDLALKGLYLEHDLRRVRRGAQRPFIYANFIASLDGRIAISPGEGMELRVPRSSANDRDWRLFQELAVQADLVLTTGRYLREYESGAAQEILQVYDDPGLADLQEWRTERGLDPYPDLAIVSRSLDFPLPAALLEGGRSLVVLTTGASPSARKAELEARSIKVLDCGAQDVEGPQLARVLQNLGYGLVYSAAGPRVAHMLLAGGVLDRLYLTLALRLLGGNDFATLVTGGAFEPALEMQLDSLYLDRLAPGPAGQLFGVFDHVPGPPSEGKA